MGRSESSTVGFEAEYGDDTAIAPRGDSATPVGGAASFHDTAGSGSDVKTGYQY